MKLKSIFFLFIWLSAANIFAQSVEPSRISQRIYSNALCKQIKELKKDSQVLFFSENRKKLSNDPYRPIYHLSSPDGIMHDPNGLCYWKGKWHLFYQFLPTKDNRQHWGHAVSDDLIHWKDLPVAIYPGPEEKVYSGATYVEKDRVIAMYYGFGLGDIVATSDDPLLLNWNKIAAPAIALKSDDGEPLPYYVFDTAIWKEDSTYYAVTGGGRTPDGPGGKKMRANYLFSSRDLKKWDYMHEFIKNERFLMPGEDAACPYFWPIGNRYIFLFFSHITGGKYFLGDYDKENHHFYPTTFGKFNFGAWGPGGVHAPSATPDGKGGVIMISNMTGGKTTPGWRGVMTLPRKLNLISQDSISIVPTGDYESLRKNYQGLQYVKLPANEEIVLDDIKGNAYELKLEVDVKESPMLVLNLLRSNDKREYTAVRFYKDRGYDVVRINPKLKGVESIIALDTGFSSYLPNVKSRPPELAPIILAKDETLKLHVFVDKSVVEVFVNGRQALAARVYPGLDDSIGISLEAHGSEAELKQLDFWQMKSIY